MRTLILRMFTPAQRDEAGVMRGIVQRPGGTPLRFSDEASLLAAVAELTGDETVVLPEAESSDRGATVL